MTDSKIPLALNYGSDGRIRGFRQAPDITVTSINAASALFTGPLSAATFYASSFTISALTVTSLDADVLNVALFEPNNIITNYLSATTFEADTFNLENLSLTGLSAINSKLESVQVTSLVGDSTTFVNVTSINANLDVIANLSFFGNEASIASLTATNSRLITATVLTGNIPLLNTTSLNAVSFNPANINTTNLTSVSITTTSLNAVSFNPATISTTNLTAVNLRATAGSATNFSALNTTATNSNITTLNATNGIVSFIQNIQLFTNLVDTLDLTSTNSRLRFPLILSGTANNLSGTNLNFTSVTAVDIVGTSANFTNVTATNLNAVSFNPASINTTNLTATNGRFTSVTSTNLTATNSISFNATATNLVGGAATYSNYYGSDAVITNVSSTTNQADQAWIKDLSSTRDFAINSSGLTIDTWQIRFPSVTAYDGNQAPYSSFLLLSANTYQGNAHYAGGPNPQFAGKDLIGIRDLDTAFAIVGDAIFIGGPVIWPSPGRHPSNPGYNGNFNPNNYSGSPPPVSSTYLIVSSINGAGGVNMPSGILFHSGDEETTYIVGYVDHVTTSIAVAPVLDAPTVDTVFGVYNKETLIRSFVNYAGPTSPIQGSLTILGGLSSVSTSGTNFSATNVTALNLTVGNNIVVGGTVDGRDISADGTTLDNHIASASVHFTVGSLTSTYSLTSHNHAISGLTDTQITATPTNGATLTWSSTRWIPSSLPYATVSYVDNKQWSTDSISGGVLPVDRGGLGKADYAEQDLIYFDGSKFNSISVGNENDVVKVIGGVWTAAPDGAGDNISATNVTGVSISGLNITGTNFRSTNSTITTLSSTTISAINVTATNLRVNGNTLGTAAFLNEGLGAGDLLTVLNAVLNFAPASHTHNAADVNAGTLTVAVNNANTTTTDLTVTSITTGGGFTNVVSGVTPTNPSHLVTKAYADALFSSIKLASDVSATTTTVIPVTGMGFNVEANSDYMFYFYVHCKTSIAATGVRIGVSGPTGTSYVSHRSWTPTTNTAEVLRHDGAYGTNQAQGTALPTNTLTYLGGGDGLLRTGPSPGSTPVCPTIAAESATGSVSFLAGSVMMVRKI